MKKDIKDFFKKLRPAEFFSENPKVDTSDSSLVISKSKFCPPQNRNSTLVSVINFLLKQNFSEENLKNMSNILKCKWQNILTLKKNWDILIIQACKVEQVVIKNTYI